MSKDINLYNCKSGERLTSQKFDGRGYSDTIKCSNVADVYIEECHIIGGKEDCIDINRGEDIEVQDCILEPTGKFAMTIKGGVDGTDIDVQLHSHGTEVDFDYGNWSDQSDRKSGNHYLQVTTTTGKPAKIRVLNSEKPNITGVSNVVYAFPHPDAFYHGLCVWFFMFARQHLGMFK